MQELKLHSPFQKFCIFIIRLKYFFLYLRGMKFLYMGNTKKKDHKFFPGKELIKMVIVSNWGIIQKCI